jgi:hypothetical protein
MEQAGGGSDLALQPISRFAGLPQGNHISASWQHAAVVPLADRIRTGCVYDWQPTTTFGLLVTRVDPRTRWRARPVLAPIHAHWAQFAPSVWLLTGHETACRARRCRRGGRCAGQMPIRLGWPAFAAAYRTELEQQPLADRLGILRQLVAWLRMYPSVTVLSLERGTSNGEALLAWEQQGEQMPWAQRHIFREWLVSLLLAGSGTGGVAVNTMRREVNPGSTPR